MIGCAGLCCPAAQPLRGPSGLLKGVPLTGFAGHRLGRAEVSDLMWRLLPTGVGACWPLLPTSVPRSRSVVPDHHATRCLCCTVAGGWVMARDCRFGISALYGGVRFPIRCTTEHGRVYERPLHPNIMFYRCWVYAHWDPFHYQTWGVRGSTTTQSYVKLQENHWAQHLSIASTPQDRWLHRCA